MIGFLIGADFQVVAAGIAASSRNDHFETHSDLSDPRAHRFKSNRWRLFVFHGACFSENHALVLQRHACEVAALERAACGLRRGLVESGKSGAVERSVALLDFFREGVLGGERRMRFELRGA